MAPDQDNVFWLDGATGARFPALALDCTVDVAIIGAGMVGLHCAWALHDQGLRVAVVEARRIGRQATGRSTAKVTSQHGLCYAQIARDFGDEAARIHARENERALGLVADLSARIGDQAAFERRDAYVYATDDTEANPLQQEAEAARRAGLAARLDQAVPAPVDAVAALRFPDQGQFDPFGYLQGLAGMLAEHVQIFEESRVTAVKPGQPCEIRVNGHTVRAGVVVVSTQIPVIPEGHFFAKAFPFAHPVAAAPLPEGVTIDGMFVSAGSPGRALRTARRGSQTFLVAAGRSFSPGARDAEREAIDDLRGFLNARFGIANPSHLWTNEDFRPMDGAAFIGPADRRHPNLLIATGFAAWGLTQGAVAGDILASLARGREHPAAALYDATRHKPIVGGATFLRKNIKAGAHLVGDRLLNRKTVELSDIGPGTGGVIVRDGEKLAVRSDASGKIAALSAICTHMGCVVDWNATDRTWDCPCHGSRFDAQGAVLTGPATAPLEPRSLGDWEKDGA